MLSDSSESLRSCDLPRHILRTIGGFDSSRLAVLLFTGAGFSAAADEDEWFLEVKNFRDAADLLGSVAEGLADALDRLEGDTYGSVLPEWIAG